jgi:hypothetical protein
MDEQSNPSSVDTHKQLVETINSLGNDVLSIYEHVVKHEHAIKSFITRENLEGLFAWHEMQTDDDNKRKFKMMFWTIIRFYNNYYFSVKMTIYRLISVFVDCCFYGGRLKITHIFDVLAPYPPFATHLNAHVGTSTYVEVDEHIVFPEHFTCNDKLGDEWIDDDYSNTCNLSQIMHYHFENGNYCAWQTFLKFVFSPSSTNSAYSYSVPLVDGMTFYEDYRHFMKTIKFNSMAVIHYYPPYREYVLQIRLNRYVVAMSVCDETQIQYNVQNVGHRVFANDYVMRIVCKYL